MTGSRKKGIAETARLVLSCRAVRGRGGSAGEPRQALIGATVVCPCLPRIPWRHFFRSPPLFSKLVRHHFGQSGADRLGFLLPNAFRPPEVRQEDLPLEISN